MKIVILDGALTNPGDLSWDRIAKLGELTVFDQSSEDQIIERCEGAQIIITNKVRLEAHHLNHFPELKCICLLATGYNNIDLKAAKSNNITVCNAVGYSTPSVAQHVFALILHFTNHVNMHNNSVKHGEWHKRQWSYSLQSPVELNEKVLGIYGFGRIGQQVANIGRSFGMEIIAHHKYPLRDAQAGVRFVDLDTLFRESDYLTLHAPLTVSNKHIINATSLQKMKSSAVLINTGRGDLVSELELYHALKAHIIAGAGLDVLSKEPPIQDNPLVDLDNCIITPHNAWATKASRSRLVNIVAHNIISFKEGKPANQVQ